MKIIESQCVQHETTGATGNCVLASVLQLSGCPIVSMEYTVKDGQIMLTDAAIKALKPRQVQYLVTDGRGLCMEVLASGYRFN